MTYTSRKLSVSMRCRSSPLSSLQQTPRRPSWCRPHFAGSGAGTSGVAEEIAQTGGAFAFPAGGERLSNATDAGCEFVTVTSDAVDADAVCEEDMICVGGEVRSSRGRRKDSVVVWPLRVTYFRSDITGEIPRPIGSLLLGIGRLS